MLPALRRRGSSALPWVVALLAAGALAWAGVVRTLESSMLFHPTRPLPHRYERPLREGARFEDVDLLTRDYTALHAWWVRAEDPRGTFLYLHGNAGNVSDRYVWIRALSRMRMNVLALDYRGYGKSSGTPDEAGLYEDAETAYLHLLDTRRVHPDRLVLYGSSLGGAVAVDLASRLRCAGVILQSTFSSLPDLAETMVPLPAGPFLTYRFDSLSKIRDLEAPLLMIHSRGDEVIPYRLGERLYQAAPLPKRMVTFEKVGHNDLLLREQARLQQEVRAFLDFALAQEEPL